MDVVIGLEDRDFPGPVTVSEVNGRGIKAENDFGKTLVNARPSSITANGRTLTHSFPAHSYTQLRAILG
jgi:alpha-N-arabinofuranosidase